MKPPPEAAARLQLLLGGTALAALRQRLRRAYEQARPGAEPQWLRLAALAPHEAEALQSLSGRAPSRSASVQLDLPTLGLQLQAAGLASSLRAALEQLDGPITPRAAERAAAASAWARLVAGTQHARLQALLAQPAGLGLLKRLAGSDTTRADTLCAQAARVLAALPAQGQPRASLAARCLGDAHALDKGQPVATLVLAALRHAPQPTSTDADADANTAQTGDNDEGTRAQWAAQGVSVNELARPALSLNLPHADAHANAHAAADAAADGEPRYWSLRQLLRTPPAWRVAGRDVWVCENPNLLAMAADALGPRCAPLLCTDGMPAAAQRALLGQVVAAGASLHYHGDFDWPGITIANRVQQDFGARAWRMGAADYRAAVCQAATGAQAPLPGAPVTPLWDAALGTAMQELQRAIAEEALWSQLEADLVAAR